MNIQEFEKLYCISVDDYDKLGNRAEKLNFVFQRSNNWDMYFSNHVDMFDFDMIEFEEKLSKMNRIDVIDYSIEHAFGEGINEYYVLSASKNV
jgi:hypothetical protein